MTGSRGKGSGDCFDAANGGAIDGVVSRASRISALKPFTYAAAFERITPGHALADVPQFPTAEPTAFSTASYDGAIAARSLARAALAGSGVGRRAARRRACAVARLLDRAGFTTLDNNAAHYGLGLTLGNAEVRLSELVAGYAMFARGAVSVSPRFVTSVSVPQSAHRRRHHPRVDLLAPRIELVELRLRDRHREQRTHRRTHRFHRKRIAGLPDQDHAIDAGRIRRANRTVPRLSGSRTSYIATQRRIPSDGKSDSFETRCLKAVITVCGLSLRRDSGQHLLARRENAGSRLLHPREQVSSSAYVRAHPLPPARRPATNPC